LKRGNLDKFEFHSSDGILLGYTPHGRSYRVFNLETSTVTESYDVIFDETTPYPRNVFECAGDKEIEKNIFIDEELQGFDDDKDESLLSTISSAELVSAFTLKTEAPHTTTSSTVVVEASTSTDHR
jgi:hypothetical protein